MCTEVLVKRGEEETYCTSVGELADALKMQPIMVSQYEDRDHCLCGARFSELGAREATNEEGAPFPDYIIELPTKCATDRG